MTMNDRRCSATLRNFLNSVVYRLHQSETTQQSKVLKIFVAFSYIWSGDKNRVVCGSSYTVKSTALLINLKMLSLAHCSWIRRIKLFRSSCYNNQSQCYAMCSVFFLSQSPFVFVPFLIQGDCHFVFSTPVSVALL